MYKEYYSANLSLIIAFTSTLYSKIIINLQLCICTGDKNSNFLDVILSSILILINYVFKNEMLLILSCSISMIIVGSNLIKLIYIRSNEILNYLNIRFLVIPYDKEKTMKIED